MNNAERFIWDYYFAAKQRIAKSLETCMLHADESLELYRGLSDDRKRDVLDQLGYQGERPEELYSYIYRS